MRLHEALLCVAAIFAPFIALATAAALAAPPLLLWMAPVATFFVISLPLVWVTGWLIDHTYG
jgi:hypothetical protein